MKMLFALIAELNFSQIPTPQQNMAPTNINYNTSNSNTMPPYMHNQQTQQINNMPNPNNMQMASQEFAIGQQYMDINNPQHNYIKAINHFQKIFFYSAIKMLNFIWLWLICIRLWIY